MYKLCIYVNKIVCILYVYGQYQQDYKFIYLLICNVNIIRNIYNYVWD